MQGRFAITTVTGIDFCTAADEVIGCVIIAGKAASAHQGRAAYTIALVHIRPELNQEFHNINLPVGSREAKGGYGYED